MPPKPFLGENLQLKPVHSVSAYFLTTDEAIVTKLDQNIKQIKLLLPQVDLALTRTSNLMVMCMMDIYDNEMHQG